MKFYTMDWWIGVQQFKIHDPTPDYQRHLAKIRSLLPADLLKLQESISLHDADLRQMHLDTKLNSLEILLVGDDGKGGLCQYRLFYTGVISCCSTADRGKGFPGPSGYGDLGYDEADVTEDCHFEHRMLFSTGIEFQVVFTGFDLEWRDIE